VIKNKDGEKLEIPKKYLGKSLRKPEEHMQITPKVTHYLVLIPPGKIDSETLEYIAWGKKEHARRKAKNEKKTDWVDTYCKSKNIPWYSYMYHDAMTRSLAKGRIALMMKFRMKKRPCIAYYFDDEVRAPNMYFLGSTDRRDFDKVLVAWYNSTLFLALYLYSRREIAGDWGQVKIVDLNRYMCINPRKLSQSDIDSICAQLDKMRELELPMIPAQLGVSPRIELDLSIAQALEIPNARQLVSKMHEAVKNELAALN
jgi:hypothetical protein